MSALLALVAVVAACEVSNRLQLQAGSTPFAPVFVLMDATGHSIATDVYGLSVLPCGSDTALWTISATGANSTPERIVYGQAPAGYLTTAGPAPLKPGCYDVYATNAARVRFRVAADGSLAVAAK